jgi:transcription antitermination factor NusG
LQKELKHWNDRKAWVETPLFKSYVFIKTDYRKKNLVFRVNGILKYVSIGHELAILSEDEIDRVRQICLYRGKINIECERPEAGKQIEISGGVLKGLIGYLIKVSNDKKVCIRIKGLNCFASVTVNLDSISYKYIS